MGLLVGDPFVARLGAVKVAVLHLVVCGCRKRGRNYYYRGEVLVFLNGTGLEYLADQLVYKQSVCADLLCVVAWLYCIELAQAH